MNKFKTLAKTTRPPFLVLTPACIALGIVFAYSSHLPIALMDVSLVAIAGIFAHVSVNTFNEYFDFKSGLDLKTQRTPFNGGSGALPNNPKWVPATFRLAFFSLFILCVIGIYFVLTKSTLLLPLGLLGTLIIYFYTEVINKHAILCLLAPGLCFGPLMVVGSYLVFGSDNLTEIALISLIPFFQVNNLLLLNQFPDISADRECGRRHLLIHYGTNVGKWVYTLLGIAAYLSLILMIIFHILPQLALIALLPMLLQLPLFVKLHQLREFQEELLPLQGQNVLITLATPVLLSVAIIISTK